MGEAAAVGRQTPDDAGPLIAAAIRWAGSRADIVALGLVGSYARAKAGPDSDVDLIVVADDPDVLGSDATWLRRFGAPLSVVREDYGLVQSLRCLYQHGPEIEFGLTDRRWCTPPIDQGTAGVIRDGLCILHDPTGVLRRAREWVAAASGH